MARPMFRGNLLTAACCWALSQSALAQVASLGNDEARVLWVDGRPMLRATLRAGEKVYFCHLLLDLAAKQGLFLHANAAGSLRSESADVQIDDIEIQDLPFSAEKDPWLEDLTARFAAELHQIPVAGILGPSAFEGHDVRIDGPGGRLSLLPMIGELAEPIPSSENVVSVPLAGDPSSEILLELALPAGRRARFHLTTRDPFCWLDPVLAREVGAEDGALASARAAPGLDFARFAPFRPEVPAQGVGRGGIGGAVLSRLVLTIQRKAGRLIVESPREIAYPETEAALYRAMYGSSRTADLTRFLKEHPDAPQAPEASEVLLDRLRLQGGSPTEMEIAGLAAIRAAAANKKGTAALEVLRMVPRTGDMIPARQAIAEAGLAESRGDEDGNAAHKLRLELGILAMELGDSKQARRHLLAAVFGMPTAGAPNLAMAEWHEAEGQLEQALGRCFLALLDMRNTGQEGFVEFERVFRKLHGQDADMLAALRDMADGRVPSFQPIPREAGTFSKTGRTVLVELFTGAMCPPCVAADVAADALADYFDRDEIELLQWHLPIPAPEPLVAQASLDRARARGVGGTPTLVVAGGEPIAGGGRTEDVPEVFARYRERVEQELSEEPSCRLTMEAALEGDDLRFAAEATEAKPGRLSSCALHAVLAEDLVAFPGKNGILFHHRVVRARLTARGGVPLDRGPIRGSVRLSDVRKDLDELVRGMEEERAFLVRPVAPDPRRLSVVCFVEDRTGRVLQAASAPVSRGEK
ncbi:MAG: hypothetical protein Fur0037_07040 [Planctomycetota bacterium]